MADAKKDKLQIRNSTVDFLVFTKDAHEDGIEVRVQDHDVWLTQKAIAQLFDVDRSVVTKHLKNVYESGELSEDATCANYAQVADNGKTYHYKFYSLPAIIAVGYRINSGRATQFRQWATKVLDTFTKQGYVLDKSRLINGQIFDEDYFDHLISEIQEIRASERRFYQKITDIYEECSIDYDSKSETTQQFFKSVRDTMHWAVTHQTEAEIVYLRADAKLPHMGLTTWKNAPNGRVQRSDAIAAKNYLSDIEASSLNRLSSAFIDMAELRAQKQLLSTMEDWKKFLDDFLTLYDYDKLDDAGTISAEQAKEKAYAEYDKFRLIQDKEYLSDFDKEIRKCKELGLR